MYSIRGCIINNPLVKVDSNFKSTLYNSIILDGKKLLFVTRVAKFISKKFLYILSNLFLKKNKLVNMHIIKNIVGLNKALLSLFKKIIIVVVSTIDPPYNT